MGYDFWWAFFSYFNSSLSNLFQFFSLDPDPQFWSCWIRILIEKDSWIRICKILLRIHPPGLELPYLDMNRLISAENCSGYYSSSGSIVTSAWQANDYGAVLYAEKQSNERIEKSDVRLRGLLGTGSGFGIRIRIQGFSSGPGIIAPDLDPAKVKEHIR